MQVPVVPRDKDRHHRHQEERGNRHRKGKAIHHPESCDEAVAAEGVLQAHATDFVTFAGLGPRSDSGILKLASPLLRLRCYARYHDPGLHCLAALKEAPPGVLLEKDL